MRTNTSRSLSGFVTVVAVALAGCSPSTDAELLAESPAAAAAEPGETAGPAKPKAEPRAVLQPTPSGLARPEVGGLAKGTVPLAELGQACIQGADCATGSCSDGVCCDVPCDGTCEVCDATGLCVPRPAGSDPDHECGAPACNAGVQEAFWCDGAGACMVQIESCGAYVCGDAACLRECRSDADCIEPARCQGGSCAR